MTHVLDGCDLSMPEPGRLLPPRAFFSPAVFDAEMTKIFARSWVHVADLADVQAAGDYVAATIGTSPVVIVGGIILALAIVAFGLLFGYWITALLGLASAVIDFLRMRWLQARGLWGASR